MSHCPLQMFVPKSQAHCHENDQQLHATRSPYTSVKSSWFKPHAPVLLLVNAKAQGAAAFAGRGNKSKRLLIVSAVVSSSCPEGP